MSGLRLALIATVSGLLVPAASVAQVRNAAPQKISASASAPRAVLDKYCVTCHNQRAKTAGLALDTLDLTQVSDRAAVWEAVEAGSAYVAPRRVREIALRWEREGYPVAPDLLPPEPPRGAPPRRTGRGATPEMPRPSISVNPTTWLTVGPSG